MKKVLVFSFSMFLYCQLNAQVMTTATTSQVVAGLKNTTYVVLTEKESEDKVNIEYQKITNDTIIETENNAAKKEVDDSEFNKELRSAVKSFWKVTKYEFINEQEFEKKRLDPTCSFIFQSKIKEDMDGEKVEFNYLIFAVGSAKAKKIEKMPWIAAIPLSYNSIDAEYYNYKLAGLVKFLQTHADYAANNSDLTKESIEKYYSKKNKEIKDYILYVIPEDLTTKVYTEEQINNKLYSGEVKIVDQATIQEAIKKSDPNAVFFHKVGPERTKKDTGLCRKYIITAKGGELLYYLEEEITKSKPEGLLESDFKQFNKK